MSASYLRSENKQPVNNPLSHAYKYGPLESPYWSDGRISAGRNGTNSWARLNYGGFNNSWGDELVGRLALNFTPIKNLTFSGVIAPSVRSVKGKQFIKQVPYYDYDNTTTTSGFIGGNLSTSLAEERTELRTMTKQLTANYTTNFDKKHNLSLMKIIIGFQRYLTHLLIISRFQTILI